MCHGKLIFAQAIDHLPHHTLRRCIQRYQGNHHVKRFSCQDQYRCMAFAQLTYRESLRDDANTGKKLVFLTNNVTLPALTITELYQCRWQVELFFKWTKQHLRIKSFFGMSLYTILQILSLTLFERIPLNQLIINCEADMNYDPFSNQLNLFDQYSGH